mmetsp:Transcript_24073/g.67160  ORF Transcript_24073/g.67160 Transcript_24073/m.67160 type:complete len:152 (+) Transcript_24073:174-629(+)
MPSSLQRALLYATQLNPTQPNPTQLNLQAMHVSTLLRQHAHQPSPISHQHSTRTSLKLHWMYSSLKILPVPVMWARLMCCRNKGKVDEGLCIDRSFFCWHGREKQQLDVSRLGTSNMGSGVVAPRNFFRPLGSPVVTLALSTSKSSHRGYG